MLWILSALFFVGLAAREILGATNFFRPRPIYVPYLVGVIALAVACAWPPISKWRFEKFLSAKATELTELTGRPEHARGRRASVHCNSFFDTVFDSNVMAIGHANFETGEIVLQYLWCDKLKSFLDHPQRADQDEIISLNVFTHEAMHVRGERNEALTECQAVQRNYRAAKLLGVPDDIAKKSARRYFDVYYKMRGDAGGMAGAYFSNECAPGKAMDEGLPDSTWVL